VARRIEFRVRNFLNDPRVWVGIAYFGLAAVVVALYVAFGRIAKEDASRAALERANAVAAVNSCFTALKQAPVVDGFIDSVELLISDEILTTKQVLAAEAPGDPLRAARQKSLVRLNVAKGNADVLRELIDKTTPTKEKCMRLALRLNVDVKVITGGQ
jgi:hypothetical protein